MKPFYCPPLKCNPTTTGPHCIPQNTKCRFPVDHLRRATVPCYGPHGIYDMRPAQQGNPQKRSDQLSESTTDSWLIKLIKLASRRQRNASSPFHIKLLSQLPYTSAVKSSASLPLCLSRNNNLSTTSTPQGSSPVPSSSSPHQTDHPSPSSPRQKCHPHALL